MIIRKVNRYLVPEFLTVMSEKKLDRQTDRQTEKKVPPPPWMRRTLLLGTTYMHASSYNCSLSLLHPRTNASEENW